MRFFCSLLVCLFLASCNDQKIEALDLSEYFMNIRGTAVFYDPINNKYKIHNIPLSQKRSSPCSTFKIMSAYIGLSEKVISRDNSLMSWNKTIYWNSDWNKDITLDEAFRTSCIWYFRRLIDIIGSQKTTLYLREYKYGNQNISDWQGNLNTNTDIAELKGFWVESSLLISPVEQTEVLARIFAEDTKAGKDLKEIMKVSDGPSKIYGKTGMGVKDDLVVDAWFVGFYEKDSRPIYFSVRLDDAESRYPNYRKRASLIAKEIAINIINQGQPF